MSTAQDTDDRQTNERVSEVEINQPNDQYEGSIVFHLLDGRTISVPLNWSWRLKEATPEERNVYEISPAGRSVHWPEVDEDISVEGMLRGSPAPETRDLDWDDIARKSWSPGEICNLREMLDDTQEEFADRINTRQSTISQWESGTQTPQGISLKVLDLLYIKTTSQRKKEYKLSFATEEDAGTKISADLPESNRTVSDFNFDSIESGEN